MQFVAFWGVHKDALTVEVQAFCAMMVFGPNSTIVVNFNCFCSTNQRSTKYRQLLLTIYHMTVHKRRQTITKILVLSFDSQATTRYSPQTNQLQNGIPFPRSNNREGFSAYQIQLCTKKFMYNSVGFLSYFDLILNRMVIPSSSDTILLVITRPTGLQCIVSRN